jgi:hypothetical protein
MDVEQVKGLPGVLSMSYPEIKVVMKRAGLGRRVGCIDTS